MSTPIIERFLTAVGRRLKTGIRSRVVSRCLLAGSAAALLWALGWRVFGYAAPREGYAVAVVLALVAGAIWMRISRPGVRDAAHQAEAPSIRHRTPFHVTERRRSAHDDTRQQPTR